LICIKCYKYIARRQGVCNPNQLVIKFYYDFPVGVRPGERSDRVYR
jgi:hypothetical protein